jgi:hypothetical protein
MMKGLSWRNMAAPAQGAPVRRLWLIFNGCDFVTRKEAIGRFKPELHPGLAIPDDGASFGV